MVIPIKHGLIGITSRDLDSFCEQKASRGAKQIDICHLRSLPFWTKAEPTKGHLMGMITTFANPKRFMALTDFLLPHLVVTAIFALVLGLYYALCDSPPDYQQGETVRILYLHVPAAMISMMVYTVMAFASLVFLVWKHSVADVIARASAPVGAALTFITLITGSLWGKPMWGAWWVWDARLTSYLILFFLYLGYLAIARQADNDTAAQKICAVLAILGAINIPIIKFSVTWWNTLHQPASLFREGGNAIDSSMMLPLSLMILAFALFYTIIVLYEARTLLMGAKIRRLQMKLFG